MAASTATSSLIKTAQFVYGMGAVMCSNLRLSTPVNFVKALWKTWTRWIIKRNSGSESNPSTKATQETRGKWIHSRVGSRALPRHQTSLMRTQTIQSKNKMSSMGSRINSIRPRSVPENQNAPWASQTSMRCRSMAPSTAQSREKTTHTTSSMDCQWARASATKSINIATWAK